MENMLCDSNGVSLHGSLDGRMGDGGAYSEEGPWKEYHGD